FREVEQPWIDRYLFRPPRQLGHEIVHLDQKEEPGVDLAGDLYDDAFRARVAAMSFRSVLCSNLLEHVTDREEIAEMLTAVLPPQGFLFPSCPRRSPYHPDPIDTMFRPDLDELARLFPGADRIEGAVVDCGMGLRELLGDWYRKPLSFPLAVLTRLLRRSAGD